MGTVQTLLKHAPNREAVAPTVVIRRVDIRTIEAEVIHIVTIVARRRPEAAAAALTRGRTIVEAAREGKGGTTIGD